MGLHNYICRRLYTYWLLLWDFCLALSQTTNFRLYQTERVCRRKFYENSKKSPKRVENTVGKGEIACDEQFLFFSTVFLKDVSLRAISPFPTMFSKNNFSFFPTVFSKNWFYRHVKSRDCLGKDYKKGKKRTAHIISLNVEIDVKYYCNVHVLV